MKICAVSDLHIDIGSQPPIEWPEADVLVIAGDTGNTIGAAQKLIKRVEKLDLYRTIVTVDGNHEHYSNEPQHRTIDQTIDRLDDLLQDTILLPVVPHHKVDDVYFVGINGWYSFDYSGDPEANKRRYPDVMNDDRWIGFSKMGLTPPWGLAHEHAAIMAERIEEIVSREPDAKIVAVTHTAPCRETLSTLPQHIFDNCFYANLNMEPVMEKYSSNIKLWVHGHTHYRQEKIVHGIPVLVNPRGYPTENPRWEPVVIEV